MGEGCLVPGDLLLGGCLVLGGVPGPRGGACSWGEGVPGGDPPDGYCCGRYASYWNAFLLSLLISSCLLSHYIFFRKSKDSKQIFLLQQYLRTKEKINLNFSFIISLFILAILMAGKMIIVSTQRSKQMDWTVASLRFTQAS